jgi:hypothetical protein
MMIAALASVTNIELQTMRESRHLSVELLHGGVVLAE